MSRATSDILSPQVVRAGLPSLVSSSQAETAADQRGLAPIRTEHGRRFVTRALMTRREAANYLRVSERTIDRLRKQKLIPSVKVARGVRFLPEDIESYLRQCRR
jgi:excisionase family DNA binding protein